MLYEWQFCSPESRSIWGKTKLKQWRPPITPRILPEVTSRVTETIQGSRGNDTLQLWCHNDKIVYIVCVNFSTPTELSETMIKREAAFSAISLTRSIFWRNIFLRVFLKHVRLFALYGYSSRHFCEYLRYMFEKSNMQLWRQLGVNALTLCVPGLRFDWHTSVKLIFTNINKSFNFWVFRQNKETL